MRRAYNFLKTASAAAIALQICAAEDGPVKKALQPLVDANALPGAGTVAAASWPYSAYSARTNPQTAAIRQRPFSTPRCWRILIQAAADFVRLFTSNGTPFDVVI